MDILSISILFPQSPCKTIIDHFHILDPFEKWWKNIPRHAGHTIVSFRGLMRNMKAYYIYIYNRPLVMMVVQCPNLPATWLLINSLFKLTTKKTPNFGTTGSFMWRESTSELSITPQTHQNCGKRFYILSILYAIILHISFIITGPMW